MFQYCDLTTQQRYISKQNKLAILLDLQLEFLTAYDQAGKSSEIPLPKPKIGIGSTLSKHNLFAHGYKDIRGHFNRQVLLSFPLKRTRSVFFTSSNSAFTVTNWLLQRLLTLTIAKLVVFRRTANLTISKMDFVKTTMTSWQLRTRVEIGCLYYFRKAARENTSLWRSCNYFEIHWWLWKLWSVDTSSTYFHDTAATKDSKNRWNTLFVYQKDFFNPKNAWLRHKQTKYMRIEMINLCVDKSYKILIEMCILRNVKSERVLTFQPVEALKEISLQKVQSQLSGALNFRFKEQKTTMTSLGGDGSIVFGKRPVVTPKMKNRLAFFKIILRQSNSATTEPKLKNNPLMTKTCLTFIG